MSLLTDCWPAHGCHLEPNPSHAGSCHATLRNQACPHSGRSFLKEMIVPTVCHSLRVSSLTSWYMAVRTSAYLGHRPAICLLYPLHLTSCPIMPHPTQVPHGSRRSSEDTSTPSLRVLNPLYSNQLLACVKFLSLSRTQVLPAWHHGL